MRTTEDNFKHIAHVRHFTVPGRCPLGSFVEPFLRPIYNIGSFVGMSW